MFSLNRSQISHGDPAFNLPPVSYEFPDELPDTTPELGESPQADPAGVVGNESADGSANGVVSARAVEKGGSFQTRNSGPHAD